MSTANWSLICQIAFSATLCLLPIMSVGAPADNWKGTFAIIPVSAPEMVLEAVDSGTTEGTVVSIGKPNGQPNQKWIISPLGEDLYTIKPSYSDKLALAAAGGGKQMGTGIVLETYAGKPWQEWHIKRTPSNGSVCLVPRHAPDRGMDDFGGHAEPGSKQDIWEYLPDDAHLQWTLKPMQGATYPPDLPKAGTIRDFVYAESNIFPGTTRRVFVFVPAEYDGSKPACVYVRQDGYNPAEKGMLEVLIGKKEMPVTIGVFIESGNVPPPMANTMGRRNRCFEYDAVGDAYVRFLTEELLPYVAHKYDLKLSNSGNDRCIAGGSSGGIAAFNAAWERPDAFTRVYANSGSFVAFRGGHEFPTLIRKFEPKPIRAYLTTGTNDMENCAGDWFLLDQEMDKALKFSGYDYFFRAIKGPHVAGWNEFFPEAMRFIWKGWPEPVQAGIGAPRYRDIVADGKGWEQVAKGLGDARSPVCNSKGEVFFVDARANRIHRIGLDGKDVVFVNDALHANGLAVGAKDELYTVSETTRNLMLYDAAGNGRIYAGDVSAQYALARPNGDLYASGAGKIWLLKDGKKTVVDTGLKIPTGMACRPDQWLLSVADGGSKWVYSYQIQPDGTLTNKERFFRLHVADWDDDAGPASVCYAREGQMFVATRMGIQVCADDGPTQVILPLPDKSRAVGVCLGGPEGNTLYAFSVHGVWKREVKAHLSGPFSPWTGVGGTPL